jgi:hypothetical protein
MEYSAMKNSTVVIGCKMPNGLFLDIGTPGSPGYKQIKINGANEGEMREGGLFVAHTVGGFGRTTLDAKLWNDWATGADIVGAEQINEKHGTVKMSAADNRSRMIAARKARLAEWQAKDLLFVAEDTDLALAQANEKAAAKSGFEPMAQAGDPRAPKAVVKAA